MGTTKTYLFGAPATASSSYRSVQILFLLTTLLSTTSSFQQSAVPRAAVVGDASCSKPPIIPTAGRISRSSRISHQSNCGSSRSSTTGSTALNDMDRRSALWLSSMMTSMLLSPLQGATAATETSSSSTPTTTTTLLAPVTQKAVFNVRVSRQDGTFFVRDDLEDIPENKVFYGTLVMGLFGTVAPKAVELFTSYITTTTPGTDSTFVDNDNNNPLPNYGRSTFPRLDQSTGLLYAGVIPSLEVTELMGGTVLRYGGRILNAPLWIDSSSSTSSTTPSSSSSSSRLSHTTKGLLTHRILDVSPTFGITTRACPEGLDGTHLIFGQLLLDDSSRAFLELVQDLPTYSMEKPRGDPRQESTLDTVSSAVFNSQREVFRSVAKTFGDSRVSKVYEGKLLRRVEVTQVQLL